MDSNTNYSEDLRIIKKVMEESSRFLSLSGLSGVFAGLLAIIGAAFAVVFFLNGRVVISPGFSDGFSDESLNSMKIGLSLEALVVLILAIGVALYSSYRKSARKGIKMWTPISKRFLFNFLVPLATGGFFIIIILCLQKSYQLVVPSMLIFYGLSLVNAGKFTYSDIFYLGLLEITAGLFAAVFPAYGILFWIFGFGLLHIIYGLIMYRKYEG